MTCSCSHPVPAPGAIPKATGRVRIDRAALRRELAGLAEIREAMTSKLAGRPSANVGTLWLLYAKPSLMHSQRAESAGRSILWPAPTTHNYRRFSRSISLSGGVKLPLRRLGGMTASSVSSLSTGSARR